MNAVATATNSQSIHTYERHRGGASFDLVKKITGSIQNGKILSDYIPEVPAIGSFRSTWRGNKHDVRSHLFIGSSNDTLQPLTNRAEFDNNVDGTGDGHLIPNNSDGPAKGVRPMKSGDIPSYLQTTLSYRMKCVHKPKSDPGDGQRIPFVVGNYANKSHNVGSKIQETLSLIKGAPKRLLEKTKNEKEELGNLVRFMKAGPAPPLSHTRGKYDELRNSLKDKYDVEVAHQIMNLEEELNAKDVEINAFVNLFNEVIQLKKRLSRTGGLKNEPTHTKVQSEDGSEDHGLRAYRKEFDQLNNAKNKVH